MTKIFEISNYADIESLWNNNQPETLNLEFKKELTSDNKEVAKDISSFANSEGGVIIYGLEEENGRAKTSLGIPIGQSSERIQQIVSSSIAPPLQIDIVLVNVKHAGSTPSNEFLIVKIPKSTFMIHQVTTTSRFYLRNNTTTAPNTFQALEMKENEIALRYENRFKLKQNQIEFIKNKELEIVKETNWNAYVLISITPHVRLSDSIRIDYDFFNLLFATNNNLVIYNDLPRESAAYASMPIHDGRSSDPHTIQREYFEINTDRSIHICIRLDGEHNISMFTPMFTSGPMIHLANRIFQDTGYYGGATFRLRVNGSITTENNMGYVDIPHGGRTVSDFEIQHELNNSPINVKDEYKKIFQKYFEALHIDNAVTLFENSTLKNVLDGLDASDRRMNPN